MGSMTKALGLCLAAGAVAIAAAPSASALASSVTPTQCAAKPLIELPVNSWAAARQELAPPGAAAIRLCRYNAFASQRTRDLAATALVTSPSTVGALVGDLDALKSLSGTVFCPADNGAEVDMILTYHDGHGVFIRVGLTGCALVSNGSVNRTAATTAAGHRLLSQIEQLTGYKGAVF
jgi:hypothetical protein